MIKFLTYPLLIMLTIISLAKANEIIVSKVKLNCGHSKVCDDLANNFKSLRRSYTNLENLKTILKLYVINEGIKNFNYSYKLNNELEINLVPKKIIASVDVKIEGINMGYPSILPINKNDFFDISKMTRTKKLLREIYINKGFPKVQVHHKYISRLDNGIGIQFIIKTGEPLRISLLEINSDSSYLKKIFRRRLSSFKNKSFDIQKIKNVVDDIKALFLSYGYYLIQLDLRYKLKNDNNVELYFNIKNGDLHKFDVRVVQDKDSAIEFKSLLGESVITYKRVLNKKDIQQVLSEKLKKLGYLFPKINIISKEYQNSLGDHAHFYKVHINKGERSLVSEIEFRGNTVLSRGNLLKIYYENAFEQAARNIYDEDFYKNYQKIIRQKYIELGYVNIFIDKAQIKILPKSKNAKITFKLREGLPTRIAKITITGVSSEIKKFIFKKMKSKSKNRFNPIVFKADIEMINRELKDQGFYYAKIVNQTNKNIVKYNKDNSHVHINIEIDLDKRLFVNNLIIVGNRKTRLNFIRREIFFKKGEIITPNMVRSSQTNLLSSGLFSSVNIKPIKNISNKADILISVKEKDFGIVEIAPGVRTDLGPKLSTGVTYNNLDGMNKRIQFKGQVNQRFNLHSLDEKRRENSSSLVEYSLLTKYSENHIFESDLDFSSTLSKTRRRFFSFDADIQKMSFTTSWDIRRWLSTSLTYQFSTISQYDSTLIREQGHFQIGSLTPGFTLDLRNNRINPSKGAYFNLTCEIANPTFLSQSNDELEINYYKIISRNKFYAKIPNGVLAMSIAAGYEKNLASNKKSDGAGGSTTVGYIPNIKVFRLSGMDIVRGFENDEINRLVTNTDISEARVDQKAYMASIKLEPRFYLSDVTMLGIFYDAGRVFVDTYNLNKLRSSVGISFKYLTPVGTLNLDYGIKLLRKRNSDGRLESPGRLHVSIGFF